MSEGTTSPVREGEPGNQSDSGNCDVLRDH